jgi:hypothetical protein
MKLVFTAVVVEALVPNAIGTGSTHKTPSSLPPTRTRNDGDVMMRRAVVQSLYVS